MIFQRPQLVSDEVYSHLRGEILRGNIGAQTALVEREVAEALQVSRTPVREALKQLVQDGLLETGTRGARLRVYTLKEAIDIYEVRELLEQRAAHLAAQNIGDAGVVLLERSLALQEDNPTNGNHIQHDLDFHSLIARLSGNEALQHAIDHLTGKLIGLRLLTRHEIEGDGSLEQHRAIADAICRGDRERAEQAMREHILWFKDLLVDKLNAKERDDSQTI